MKCIFSVFQDESYSVVIEKNCAYIKYEDEIESLDVCSRDCFNTLISLFSLKEGWVSEDCINPIYIVEFFSDKGKEKYDFRSNVPSNFAFFSAFIYRLVGE